MNKHTLSLLLSLLTLVSVMAQPMTTVRGKILDTDGETVPYAEVKFRDGAGTTLVMLVTLCCRRTVLILSGLKLGLQRNRDADCPWY